MTVSHAGRSCAGRLAALLAVGGMAAATAGCMSSTTYGTGKRTEIQTLEDVSGILSFSSESKEDIEYRPRGGIVIPARTDNLPPPVDDTTVAATDWPDDPDEITRKRRKQDEAVMAGLTAEEEAHRDPGFRLPDSSEIAEGRDVRGGSQLLQNNGKGMRELAEIKSSKGGSVDATGAPTRRFLTEPPSEYREPDPDSPVVIQEKKKKSGFSLRKLWPF